MKLAVDTLISATGAAGVSAYTRELTRALEDLEGLEVARIEAPPGVRSLTSRMLWREHHLGGALREAGADALLAPVPELALRALPVPAVIVVHDVFALTAPALIGAAKRRRMQLVLPRVCARASAIVCVSRATLVALHNTVGVAPGKCSVIGQGPTGLPATEPSADAGRPYLLYVGELYRRKNLITLLGALRGLDVALLMTGPARPQTLARLEHALADWDLAGRVRHLGFVSPERLGALYAGAAALVLPSVEEGFGRPLLDALALGTPAIASDIPALRELGEDAAWLVDSPLDPARWREAIAQVLDGDPGREERLARGRERASELAWPRIAREMRGVVERVAG